MTARCLVINEWLLHDLQGENAEEAQAASAEFLEKLINGPDQIAVLRDSAWMNKAYQLMKHPDPVVLALAKLLNLGLLSNSTNCRIVERSEIPALPEDLSQIDLKGDKYLFETYFAVGADELVTSDTRLIDKVVNVTSVKMIFRDDFLKTYPN